MTLLATSRDVREVREGTLLCATCSTEFPVRRGVGLLMPDPPDHVRREASGLEEFAEYMRSLGWDRAKIKQLPNIQDGYWYVQARSMHQLLTTVHFQPGQWVLDVGSNTCWASNHFAVRGLRPIALDISTAEMQGLYTSDYFILDGTSYFERILGSMYDIPIASGVLDYVFCCEVLHHNDSDSLRRTFQEAFRVLKPGGKLLIINETLKTLRDPVGVHVEGVEQFKGYEHAFWAAQYRWEAIRAGFRTRMLEPSYQGFFATPPRPTSPSVRSIKQRAKVELQSHRLGRQAYLVWLNHVRGGVQMSMIATKPVVPGLFRGSPRPRARSG